MTREEFEQKLLDIKQQEERLGVKIHLDALIDKDHLDCTWYGGEVGTIEYDDYVITIGAYGDIRLSGVVDGAEVYVKDKNNGGCVYEELGSVLDDERLHALLNATEEQGDYLVFENNNWFEVDLIAPDGRWIDLCCCDNVLSDNILDCFSNVEDYFEYVEWDKAEQAAS